jgi:hypothetical protein
MTLTDILHVAACPEKVYGVRFLENLDQDIAARAYKAQAARVHPDVGGSTERMLQLNESWKGAQLLCRR